MGTILGILFTLGLLCWFISLWAELFNTGRKNRRR